LLFILSRCSRYGLVSDFCPIFGLRRQPYILLAGVVGLAAWVWLAIMSRESEGGEDVAMGADGVGWWLVAAMLLSNISTAVADVVVDAMVAERAGASDSVEAGLQEFCWNSMFVGGEFFFFCCNLLQRA
jgi:hypothetical protein